TASNSRRAWDLMRGDYLSAGVLNLPEFDHLREGSRGPAPENAGIRLISRPSPSIVFGKVPTWHPVTASLPPGQAVGRDDGRAARTGRRELPPGQRCRFAS